ncbi:MAG TPA: EF-hand domain-containing protein [Smithellaceae bacterium]|nr:EF-hand domain-containing protein [Smithellaceae bacterium]
MRKKQAVLAILLLSVAVAFAADDLFRKIDKDADGKVSWQEYSDAVDDKFAQRDTNKDGVLTADEMKSVATVGSDKAIKKIDANADGKINKQEFVTRAALQYKKIDKNQDGFIDVKEWKAAQSSPKAPMFILFTF